MADLLSEQAIDRDNHRTLIAALAGFSYTGLLGLVALPNITERPYAIWSMLVSFLLFLAALNLQGYKARRWHDQIGDALLESATLGLIASALIFVVSSKLSVTFRVSAAALAGLIWLLDFAIRVHSSVQYLKAKEKQSAT